MKANAHTYEHYFYWLAFLIALGLRLFKLGAAPLADSEAGLALQALGLSHAGSITAGNQPGYILLTSLIFSLFKGTNFLARLLPALAGSLIVWLPFYFKRWMADSSWLHCAGLVMAFGLGIDPGLVSLSRQAGSPMLAVTFTLLTLAAFYNRRMVWVGIFAGLSILSGPAFLQGLLVMAIAWGLIRLIGRRTAQSQPDSSQAEDEVQPPAAPSVSRAIPSFALTLLFAGTLFLRAPQGLAALANTLSAYLNTWITPSGIPTVRLPASLLIYQFIIIVFAMIAFIRIWFGEPYRQIVRPIVLGLSIWVGVAILLPLFYAGRQVSDMAWALIPLWTLASVEIGRSLHFNEGKNTNIVAFGLATLLFILAIVGWMNLLSIDHDPARMVLYLAIVFGAFLLGCIGALLVAAGWSVNAARLGMVWALCLAFGFQFVSNTVMMTIVHQNGAQELWSPSITPGQVDLLTSTLSDLSSWNTGLPGQLEVVVLNGSPSMQWALRQFPNARFVTALSFTSSPPVVITLKGTEEPILAEKYRGQDFVWTLSPGWQGAFPPDFINWLTFRVAPLAQSQVILWARADIFPGGTQGTDGTPGTNGPSNPSGITIP
jgi:hypothetical protein